MNSRNTFLAKCQYVIASVLILSKLLLNSGYKKIEKHGFSVLKHLIIFVKKKLRKFCGKIMRILLAPKNPQLVPMDHGAKIRIRFFALRMERSRSVAISFLAQKLNFRF